MIEVFSYGAGVQSTAGLVLPAQARINYHTFLFCNVGDDSEHPDTLTYLRNVAMPYAEKHNITLLEIEYQKQNGQRETLYGRLTRPGSKSIGIPIRMSNGAPGNRSCTADFKIKVVDRWLRKRGAKEYGATVALGISLDEQQRARPNSDLTTMKWKENAFPLIDLRLDRANCIQIIRDAGLPVPPKSSCWFCPFHRLSVWQKMRQEEPLLFEEAVKLEELINKRRDDLGKDHVWFTRKLVPLPMATTDLVQGSLFEEEEDSCESGYCFL